jgi:transposase
MGRALPKEVVAAIELAINIAYSQNKRPDLKGIAAIFNASYEAARYINCRIRTINATGSYPKKKPGPKLLHGANQEEIEQCVREIVERDPEVQMKEILRVLKEKLDVELSTTTVSRFIKRKGIPLIGAGVGNRNIKKTMAMIAAEESEHLGQPGPGFVDSEQQRNLDEDRPMYNSPYAPTISDQNAANQLSIYGPPGQDLVAYGPYS